jgi:hypothetical protein
VRTGSQLTALEGGEGSVRVVIQSGAPCLVPPLFLGGLYGGVNLAIL